MTYRLSNYIDGKFVAPISGQYIDNINPCTQKVINLIPDSDERDVERAVHAAQRAYETWGQLHFKDRAVYLDRIAAAMQEDRTFQELVVADAQDMGKPVHWMKNGDVPRAIGQFTHFSQLIQCASTPYYQMADAVNIEHRNPIGLVGLISPWNFPVLLFCVKLSAAIVCGNCVIMKPSEITPSTAYLMTHILDKVGVPRGVVNVVHGYGAKAGEAITKHGSIRAISFTGGTATGRRIAGIAAAELKQIQLELGGKNPSIVFDDCYLEEAVEGVAFAEFLNTGQVCCSGSRLLVQRGIADKFVDKLVAHVKKVWIPNIGDPLAENTMVGPLSNAAHFNKVVSYLELAKKEGGRIVCGGKYGKEVGLRVGKEFENGNWVEPTIITGLKHDCRTAMEEIFGPILTVHVFDTEEEAIRLANEVDYGLTGSVWTADAKRGQRVARKVEAGLIWINMYGARDSRTPFGGFKNSGIQREGGLHSIQFFTEIKSIVSKL